MPLAGTGIHDSLHGRRVDFVETSIQEPGIDVRRLLISRRFALEPLGVEGVRDARAHAVLHQRRVGHALPGVGVLGLEGRVGRVVRVLVVRDPLAPGIIPPFRYVLVCWVVSFIWSRGLVFLGHEGPGDASRRLLGLLALLERLRLLGHASQILGYSFVVAVFKLVPLAVVDHCVFLLLRSRPVLLAQARRRRGAARARGSA